MASKSTVWSWTLFGNLSNHRFLISDLSACTVEYKWEGRILWPLIGSCSNLFKLLVSNTWPTCHWYAMPERGKPQTRSKRKKAKNAELPVDPKPTDFIFFSHSWLPSLPLNSWRCKVLVGVALTGALTGLNVILLFHNLDAFESRSVHRAPQNLSATGASAESTSRAQPKLRGAREVPKPMEQPASSDHSQGNFQDVPLTSAPEPVSTEPVPDVSGLMAVALAQNTTQMVKFRSASWSLSTLTLSRGQQIPYEEKYSGVNYTFGEYLGHDNVVFVSACSAKELHNMDFPFGDFLKEKAAFMHLRCSPTEVAENMEAKQLVAYINFRESGYFGHAIDNILPRIFAVMSGVVQSGHKMILVLPPLGKRSLSENTKLLCQMLGIDVRLRVPIFPHRTMGLSGVSSWSREMRQNFQRAVWASPLLTGVEAASCGDLWAIPPWRPDAESRSLSSDSCPCRFPPGIFLGRHATRNSRPVAGAEFLEAEFQGHGFEVVPDAGAVPLQQLARKIFGSCSLVGFAGTAMVNVIFLPPQAAVADVNPYLIYANTWLWAHALNYCFCQVQPPRKLDQHEAKRWASMILNHSEKMPLTLGYPSAMST